MILTLVLMAQRSILLVTDLASGKKGGQKR